MRPYPGGRGAFATGIIFIGMVLGVAVVVMALSTQSTTARSAQASTTMGRYAAELAESAVDECLADFTDFLAQKIPGQDPRQLLLDRAQGGVVPTAALTGGAPSWAYAAERTEKMQKDGRTGIKISPVTVRPLYYSTVQNYGEVEISCFATYRLMGLRELYRRVTARHWFVLDADGRTFRINPVASSAIVDRSPE